MPWCERIEKDWPAASSASSTRGSDSAARRRGLYDQARDGIADIVWTLPGYTAGRFPKMEVFEELPIHDR